MNSEEFVDAIRHHVEDAAVQDTIAALRQPPGRRVSPTERARSNWYNSLSPDQVEYVNSSIASAVHEALFGLLAVLDGARTIHDGGGRFELTHIGDRRVVLNEPNAIGLHDLLNALK